MNCDLQALKSAGLSWNEYGFVGFSGPLRTLRERIDQRLLGLARQFDAELQQFGPQLAVNDLRKIDYFSAFPHLVTYPAAVARDQESCCDFARRNGADTDGPLSVTHAAPIQTVLAPAACYAVYIALSGTELRSTPRTITVQGTCFRSEASYEPLARQPCFSMREIVRIGEAAQVAAFLEQSRERVRELATDWGLPVSLDIATDPFFDPAKSPKYLYARLFPSKHELLCHNLALASFNNHRNFFGDAYQIRAQGQAAHSACTAFGIERWMWAILRQHGPGPASWPIDTRESV